MILYLKTTYLQFTLKTMNLQLVSTEDSDNKFYNSRDPALLQYH